MSSAEEFCGNDGRARGALEIDQPPVAGATAPEAPSTGAGCTWSVSEWGVYGVILSNDFTALEYFEQARGEVEAAAVDGFGAVVNTDGDFLEACYLAVDTSHRGMVWLVVNDRRGESAEQRAEMCERAQEFAGVVLTALQA